MLFIRITHANTEAVILSTSRLLGRSSFPFAFNDKEYVRNNVPVSGITAVAESAATAVANLTQVQRV